MSDNYYYQTYGLRAQAGVFSFILLPVLGAPDFDSNWLYLALAVSSCRQLAAPTNEVSTIHHLQTSPNTSTTSERRLRQSGITGIPVKVGVPEPIPTDILASDMYLLTQLNLQPSGDPALVSRTSDCW